MNYKHSYSIFSKSFAWPVYLLCIFLFSACSDNSNLKDPISIPWNEKPVVLDKIKGMLESSDFIQLESGEESSISGMHDVFVNKEHIYILDKGQKTVFMFDRSGKFLKKCHNVGRAANEYIDIRAWAYDQKHIYLLDLKKILVFDLNLEHKYNINLKKTIPDEKFLGADRMACYQDRLLLYDYINYKIHAISKDGKKYIREVLTDLRKCNSIVGSDERSKVFYPLDEKNMLIIPDGSDYIYRIKNGETKVLGQFDYPDKEKKYRTLNAPDVDRRTVFMNRPVIISNMFSVKNTIYFAFQGHYAYVDLKNGTAGDFTSSDDDDEDYIPVAWSCSDKDHLYGFSIKENEELKVDSLSYAGTVRLKNIKNDTGDIQQFLLIHTLK